MSGKTKKLIRKSKKVNFKKFLEIERNLDRIVRFSTSVRIKDESVSEHSFHTALYAMILADLEEQFGNKVDKEKILRTALLHDLEESLTGDVIYSFKYSEEDLTREIKKIGRNLLQKLMDNLPKEISQKYMELWIGAKDRRTLEGKIIEAADKLEGLIYVMNELNLGNKSLKGVRDNYFKLLKELKLKSVDTLLRQIK